MERVDRDPRLDEASDDVLRHATQLQQDLVLLAQRGRYADNTAEDYAEARDRLQQAADAVTALETVEDADPDADSDGGGGVTTTAGP